MFNGKTHYFNGHFPVRKLLVYQRVYPIDIPLNHYKIPLNHYKIPLNHYKIPLNPCKIPVNHRVPFWDWPLGSLFGPWPWGYSPCHHAYPPAGFFATMETTWDLYPRWNMAGKSKNSTSTEVLMGKSSKIADLAVSWCPDCTWHLWLIISFHIRVPSPCHVS